MKGEPSVKGIVLDAKPYRGIKEWKQRVPEIKLPAKTIIYDVQSWATDLTAEFTLGDLKRDV